MVGKVCGIFTCEGRRGLLFAVVVGGGGGVVWWTDNFAMLIGCVALQLQFWASATLSLLRVKIDA